MAFINGVDSNFSFIISLSSIYNLSHNIVFLCSFTKVKIEFLLDEKKTSGHAL
jgi:hypothetical protein